MKLAVDSELQGGGWSPMNRVQNPRWVYFSFWKKVYSLSQVLCRLMGPATVRNQYYKRN
jgi:hypothetical protein